MKMEWKRSSQTYYVNHGHDVSAIHVNMGYVNQNYDSFGYSLGRESNNYNIPQWYIDTLNRMYVPWVNYCDFGSDFNSLKRQSDALHNQLNINPFVYQQSFKNGVFSVSFDHQGYLHFVAVDANHVKKNTRMKLIKEQY